MAVTSLTIRNLTANPLELKVVERYEAPEGSSVQGTNVFSNITKNFTNISPLISNTTVPSRPQLAEHAQSFHRRDVTIKIDPFSTAKTDIKPNEGSSNDILRLTFDQNGERHRTDLPPSSNASHSLVPLTPSPRFRFTGVFVPENTHLSIYSSAHLNSWMQDLKDATPLSGLSIPGTHNSPTYHRALPSVRCQSVPPLAQLENGVRFFDIRVQPESPQDPSKDGLLLVHGVFPISLTGAKSFRPLLTDVLAFLDAHPSETIILSLKREGPGPATDQQLSTILHDHYIQKDPRRWYTAPTIPTLGAVRGTIVLLRRFVLAERLQRMYGSGGGWGLDASHWTYNTPHEEVALGSGSDVLSVQDFCEVLEPASIETKTAYACAHLARAAAGVAPLPGVTTDSTHPVPPGPLYLNFLSASNFWSRGCWPERIAAKVNPAVVRYLCMRHGCDGEGKGIAGDAATGVVVLDWVGEGGDWDIVRCIVGMNAKLEMREKNLN